MTSVDFHHNPVSLVGSGPNVNVWYYRGSGRQMEAWDLLVMDYCGSLD
jgi:Xaa-Pro aminopeptidase